jgi:hypothetical protein
MTGSSPKSPTPTFGGVPHSTRTQSNCRDFNEMKNGGADGTRTRGLFKVSETK